MVKMEMTTNATTAAFSLLRQVPAVLRARGFRLYTQGGRRLIDLWLNGGAAVLGHAPPNLLRELKNTASRGLFAPFPHFTEERYVKALSRLFPKHSFRLYAAPPQELVALFTLGDADFWRPFSGPQRTQKNTEENASTPSGTLGKNGVCRLLVLPGIQTWREFVGGENTSVILPLGLCVVAAQSPELLSQLPPSDILPPVLLAAAARGVHDLLAASTASPQRGNPVLPRTFKALQANANWRHEGIYLFREGNPNSEEWAALFGKFLEAGFLLPPTHAQPIVLPGGLSSGEDAKLAAVLS